MRIYVAGPYTADHPRKVLENVNKAIDVAMELMKKGHSVYVPHWTHYMHLRPHCTFEYDEYVKNDMEWVKVSDAVFRLYGESKGADREVMLANRLGKLTYYYDLDSVPDAEEDKNE